MAGRLVVMAACENGAAEGIVHRDIDMAFVGEDSRVDLPVSEPGAEGKRNVLMHGLEGLKDKGVTCRCGFNAVGEGGVDEVNKKGRREEGDVGVVGVICREEIRAAGKGIRSSEEFFGDMDHLEVEVSEVDKPTHLVAVKRLGLTEIG